MKTLQYKKGNALSLTKGFAPLQIANGNVIFSGKASSRGNNKFVTGFTLVEMLIVIAIIAILASVALVSVGGVRKSARDTKRVSDISKLQQQLEVFYSNTGAYPTAAQFVTPFTTEANFKDPLGVSYGYAPYAGNNQKYVLGAIMEGGTVAMNEANELDADPSGTGMQCADASFGYCVGN